MRNNWLKNATNLFLTLITIFCVGGFVFAQETGQSAEIVQDDNEIAPPPVFVLSKEEKSQLVNELDLKRRTQLSLLLADARLRKAEEATAREDYQAALIELGSYRAIIDDHLKFLQRRNNDAGKVRDNFRRMDITLRSYTPRIEMLRRITPFEFAVHLKGIINFTRDARTVALDSFFSDSVLTETSAVRANVRQSEPTVGTNNFSKEKKP